jgi:hypothetical protein
MAGRLDAVCTRLLQVALRARVDIMVPEALGCPWRDLPAALGAATGRFGRVMTVGTVQRLRVAEFG